MLSMVLPTQAYELKVTPQPAPFSVLKFESTEAISALYRYEIELTCPVAGLPMEKVLGRPAQFIIDPVDPDAGYLEKMLGEAAKRLGNRTPPKVVHGIVTQLDEFNTSADETRYKVVLEPRTADLARAVTSRLFQNQSVQEIIRDTLKHYGYREGVDFKFNLRATYRRLEYVTQCHETTIAFIQRIAAEEGIWFRFEQSKDREVIVFGDDLDAYARNQLSAPLRAHAGLESVEAEAIKELTQSRKRVPKSVKLNDYNHRTAGISLLTEQNAAREDATTEAVDYRWGEHYPTPEEGARIAKLRHEAYLAQQVTFTGEGNVFALTAGEVLRITKRQIANANNGMLIVSVKSSGGRRDSYTNSFTAIPADRVWRTPVDSIKQPKVNGILPARVVSPGEYKYAYLTPEGWYRVKMPFDLDEWSPGGTSRPVRLAKPYSGAHYGHHFPLIEGSEVALEHTNGDPNRPVIIGCMHDSVHPDHVTNLNNTRNIIRTAAWNELRMEDRRGTEHIHLTTPHQVSELNLGHMVDAERKERGQGAELRTDGHAAIRAEKGVLISADAQPGANGQQLDMRAAGRQWSAT